MNFINSSLLKPCMVFKFIGLDFVKLVNERMASCTVLSL